MPGDPAVTIAAVASAAVVIIGALVTGTLAILSKVKETHKVVNSQMEDFKRLIANELAVSKSETVRERQDKETIMREKDRLTAETLEKERARTMAPTEI